MDSQELARTESQIVGALDNMKVSADAFARGSQDAAWLLQRIAGGYQPSLEDAQRYAAGFHAGATGMTHDVPRLLGELRRLVLTDLVQPLRVVLMTREARAKGKDVDWDGLETALTGARGALTGTATLIAALRGGQVLSPDTLAEKQQLLTEAIRLLDEIRALAGAALRNPPPEGPPH